jgi:cysteine desulfurase family protein
MTPPIIYFNNAATTWPKPASVNRTIQTILKKPFEEHGRNSIKGGIDYLESTRELLAQFFNTPTTESIVFTSNATDALNLLIHGFVKKQNRKKFHVITTELEHNSVLRPLKTLEKNGLIYLSILPCKDNKVDFCAFKNVINSDTRLVVITHGSNVLGSVQDIKKISEYLSANNIFLIVDGAQTAGQIEIDLTEIPVDAFVFTGHKSLFGFTGTGGFFLRDSDTIDSIKQGGTGIYSQLLYQPQEMPIKFETGTPNYVGIASLNAGIQYINDIGLDRIELKNKRMIEFIISELSTNENIILHNKTPELPIVSFNIKSVDNNEVGFILMEHYNTIVRTGLHCAPLVHKNISNCNGSVRISLSYLNTLSECNIVTEAIKNIANSY